MAEALADAARSHRRILAVVECERAEGVIGDLETPQQADRI
jgi:hypothetical protein